MKIKQLAAGALMACESASANNEENGGMKTASRQRMRRRKQYGSGAQQREWLKRAAAMWRARNQRKSKRQKHRVNGGISVKWHNRRSSTI